MTTVRPEREDDHAAIRAVNIAAFGSTVEADLVALLRERGRLLVSLVAESAGAVVGHIAFSRVSIAGHPEARAVGLGPMAVMPAMQNLRVGALLVNAGLDHCVEAGRDIAVVLGHPNYYPRFGFAPASRFGLRCAWEVPDDVFMARELRSGGLEGVSGLVSYEPEFNLV